MNISKIKICKTNCIKKLLKNIKKFNFSNYSLALSYINYTVSVRKNTQEGNQIIWECNVHYTFNIKIIEKSIFLFGCHNEENN